VDLVANLALQGVCEHLQAQWQEHLGVEIRLRVVELSESYRILDEESPPLFIQGWAADYPDPDNFFRVALQSSTAWWPEGYSQLVNRARRSTDQRERIDLYAQAERFLAEDAPVLPLFYTRRHLLLKPWVKRYPISVQGEFFWKDVIIEPH
jgi:ABC-type oligopeptide transport system substrate-binding subunit